MSKVKTASVLSLFLMQLCVSTVLACEPIGWRLVEQKVISISERLCVYEKSGVRVRIIVPDFCPFSPC